MLVNSWQGSEDSQVTKLSRAVACLVMVLIATPALAQGKLAKRGKLTEPEPVVAPTPEPAPQPQPTLAPVAGVEPPPEPAAVKLKVAADQKPRLAVLNIQPQGVTLEQASAITDAVVAALSSRALFDIVSTRDIETALERSDNASSSASARRTPTRVGCRSETRCLRLSCCRASSRAWARRFS